MEIPFKRVVWNEHEAVLLVDTYEKVRNGVVFRDKALVDLSKRLRNRIVCMCRGLYLYRNRNT